MTHIDPAPYGGQPITIGRREIPPLHAVSLSPDCVIQFPNAASLVAYTRANYDAQRQR